MLTAMNFIWNFDLLIIDLGPKIGCIHTFTYLVHTYINTFRQTYKVKHYKSTEIVTHRINKFTGLNFLHFTWVHTTCILVNNRDH